MSTVTLPNPDNNTHFEVIEGGKPAEPTPLVREAFGKLGLEFDTARLVSFNPTHVAPLGGLAPAIMFADLAFWGRHYSARGEWFFQTEAECQKRTGLTERQQGTAIAKLAALGIIDKDNRTPKRRRRFRVNWHRAIEVLSCQSVQNVPTETTAPSQSLHIVGTQSVQNVPTESVQNVPTESVQNVPTHSSSTVTLDNQREEKGPLGDVEEEGSSPSPIPGNETPQVNTPEGQWPAGDFLEIEPGDDEPFKMAGDILDLIKDRFSDDDTWFRIHAAACDLYQRRITPAELKQFMRRSESQTSAYNFADRAKRWIEDFRNGLDRIHPETIKDMEQEREAKEQNRQRQEREAEKIAQLDREATFETFMAEYPEHKRGTGKERFVRAAWDRVATDQETRRAIILGLRRLKESSRWRKNEGQYIPKAEDFLAERRWEQIPESHNPSRVLKLAI